MIFLSSCSKKAEDSTVPSLPASVTFAAFGNTGMAVGDGSEFHELASVIQNFDFDFAVDLGNSIPVGVPPPGVETMLEAIHEDMQMLSVPLYPVVGVNDVFDYISDMAYSGLYGPMWYSFNRGGAYFIVLNTGDESYRSRFGVMVSIGDEQLSWLRDTMSGIHRNQSVVVLMNCPVWKDAPEIWKERLLPVFKTGDVDLIVSCYEKGLYDWGTIGGIRAVSTGCTGLVKENGIGLFPHILLVTLDEESSSFRVLTPDGMVFEGISVDKNKHDMVNDLVNSLKPAVLRTGMSWDISESVEYKLSNLFDTNVYGSLEFTKYKNTSWEIDPLSFKFSLDHGETKTFHVRFSGKEPELSPFPAYHLSLQVGETTAADLNDVLLREIPRQRMGGMVPIAAQIAETVPYSFERKNLHIPVEINGPDKCGRLIIYREGATEIPVCIHVSPLRDFRIGLNEFIWDGCDLEGKKVVPDSLSYYMVVYSKKAPPTWVAEGPPSYYGTFAIEQSIGGLIAKTHTEDSIIKYRIAGSIGPPEPERLHSLAVLLDGLSLTGVAFDGDERIFMTTQMGVACAFLQMGAVRPDLMFGERGYVKFTGYRGRLVGNPALSNGILYVGIGGGNGKSPAVLTINSGTGKIDGVIPLGDFFEGEINPPALTATDRGVYIAHPDGDNVMLMNHSGELLWLNEPGDIGGDIDTDGRSFTYGIGTDQFGFTYVNTPGTSARCGVLGPDGRMLFRVILVILPGLRVSNAVPMIEGKSTDGLYFITRGADKSYVFHVPFTIRAGKIVDEAAVISR